MRVFYAGDYRPRHPCKCAQCGMLSYIRSAQLASGAIGGDARGRRPLAKISSSPPSPAGKGAGGIGRAMSRQQVTPYGTNYD